MKKNMKKILALLLTASMTLGMTFTVSATEANQQNTEEQQDTESVVSDESAEKQDSDSGAAEQVVSEEPTEDSEAEAAVTASTIESKPADGTTKDQPFKAGTGGSQNFRIPAMVNLTVQLWQQQMHVGIQQQMDMDWIQSFPDQKMVVQHGIIHLQTILETTEMFQILIPQHL